MLLAFPALFANDLNRASCQCIDIVNSMMGKLNESVGDDEASTAISRRDFPEKQLKTIHEMHLNASKDVLNINQLVCFIVSEADLLTRLENLAELASLNKQTLPSLWTVELMNFECHLSPGSH